MRSWGWCSISTVLSRNLHTTVLSSNSRYLYTASVCVMSTAVPTNCGHGKESVDVNRHQLRSDKKLFHMQRAEPCAATSQQPTVTEYWVIFDCKDVGKTTSVAHTSEVIGYTLFVAATRSHTDTHPGDEHGAVSEFIHCHSCVWTWALEKIIVGICVYIPF